MLVDANVLIHAVDERSRAHARARDWLDGALNGSRRVGLPWQSLLAFVRIVTHSRAMPAALAPEDAWAFVPDWLDAPAARVPSPGRGTATSSGVWCPTSTSAATS